MKKTTSVTKRLLDYADAREVPTYTVPDAARYLQIPAATLRSWVLGRTYPVEGGSRKEHFKPIIAIGDKSVPLLSFLNLAEAHILSAFRREHKIQLKHIRSALDFVTSRFGWERPLIEQSFQTDGVGLLIDHLGKLIDVSANGQMVLKEAVEVRLQRLEWEGNVVARLYPFTRARQTEGPKCVVIDSQYSFGRPVLLSTYIETTVIVDRYRAGESVEDLAKDYGCSPLEIEEGIRCELNFGTAA